MAFMVASHVNHLIYINLYKNLHAKFNRVFLIEPAVATATPSPDNASSKTQ